jgi:hypothetical protein
VFDGPGNGDQGWADAVFVGFDGDYAGSYEAANLIHTMTFQVREYEEVVITGAIVSWSGDIVPKSCRDRAVALLAGLDSIIRTDPTLGLSQDVIANLDTGIMFQEPFADGHACRITFTVNVKTYLMLS